MTTLKEDIQKNKPTWIWRGLALSLLGIIGFLGSWIFTEVSAAPKEYATKVEVREDQKRQDRDIDMLEQRIDDGFKETQRLILDLHKK